MNTRLIQLLLLCSLFFNIAHATVIEDDCDHERGHEYVIEQPQSTECADLCAMHHLCHFMAIITSTNIDVYNNTHISLSIYQSVFHPQDTHTKNIKPPIA